MFRHQLAVMVDSFYRASIMDFISDWSPLTTCGDDNRYPLGFARISMVSVTVRQLIFSFFYKSIVMVIPSPALSGSPSPSNLDRHEAKMVL
jgi:hypothetical protein